MPRSRGQDTVVAPKPTARGLSQLRTSSDSDPLHRFVKDRSPRLVDRRSPKGSQSDPMNQKKLGSRIADLESQLGQAQGELKKLKDQLASAEAAKKEAQEKLERKVTKPVSPRPEEMEVKHHKKEIQGVYSKGDKPKEVANDHQWEETDVFEVPRGEDPTEPQEEIIKPNEQGQEGPKAIDQLANNLEVSKPMKTSTDNLNLKNEEISSLKAALEGKDKELTVISEDNEVMKKQLAEANATIFSSQSKESEMASKLTGLNTELEASKAQSTILHEKLQAVERGKALLESEMKQLRVQTEQWRKAADAAAAVLAGEVDMNNGGRISERCGSMEKQFAGVFESSTSSYAAFAGSPGIGDDIMRDGSGSGKKRASGIKMFGDLWKKKGNK